MNDYIINVIDEIAFIIFKNTMTLSFTNSIIITYIYMSVYVLLKQIISIVKFNEALIIVMK